MPYYRWDGSGVFRDSRNDREVAPGDVVELPERVAGGHDFVEVSEEEANPAGDGRERAQPQPVTPSDGTADVDPATESVTDVAANETNTETDAETDADADESETYRCLSTDTQDGTPCQIEVDGPDETCWNH